MKFSTKSRYGLMAMLDLALNSESGPITALAIARRHGISLLYLEQLFNRLKKRGLIKSVRGPHGGYILAKEPGELKLGEILETLDGSLAPVFCLEDKPDGVKCKRVELCVPRVVWKKIEDSVRKVLDSTSLGDLCMLERKLPGRRNIIEKGGQKWCRSLTVRR